MKLKNVEIINKLFRVKTLITKASKKNIFGEKDFTVGLYELLKIIDGGASKIEMMIKMSSDSPPALSQKIKRMEEMGLLERKEESTPLKRKEFQLTKEGKSILRRTEKKITLVSSRIFLKYSREEKEVFFKILNDFEKILSKKLKEK